MPIQGRGTARDMAGRTQESVGSAMGDSGPRAHGLAKQGYGQVQKAVGQARSIIREQPMTIALLALVVGYVLGRLNP